jgi:hypothetical protein
MLSHPGGTPPEAGKLLKKVRKRISTGQAPVWSPSRGGQASKEGPQADFHEPSPCHSGFGHAGAGGAP